MLADEALRLRGVEVGGEVRATTVVLESSGRVTVMNEPGPPLGTGDWERFSAAVEAELAGARVLACSGSLPPGTPGDAYAGLTRLAHARGAVAIVDVAGEQLARALEAGPDVVTPNLAEAEGVLDGRAGESVEAGPVEVVRARASRAAAALVAHGAGSAIVTAGGAGAAVATAAGGEPAWRPAPQVTVRNPVGAGDALVGGLAVALERGEPFDAAVAGGLAAAAASVETDGAGAVDPARVRALGG
jgi:fructose-1-phosphate kinase PfkB-like protein